MLIKYEIHFEVLFFVISIYFLFQKNNFLFSFLNFLNVLFQTVLIKIYKTYKLKSKKVSEFNENNIIYDVSIFPSGKIILMTSFSIKILNNNNFESIQHINIHDYNSIDIKDENNFLITSGIQREIKTFIKQNNLFVVNQNISNLNNLNFAQYFSRKYLVAVCDNNIFIFKENSINYELVIRIEQIGCKSLLLIKCKNILITANSDDTKFRNLKTCGITKIFDEIECGITKDGITNIDNERIIILSMNNFIAIVLSISAKKILKYISLYSRPLAIHLMEKKDFFFIHLEQRLFAYNNNNYRYLAFPSLDNSRNPYEGFFRFKKIIGINDETYLLLGESKIIIYKY